MGCRSDYMEPNARERELTKVLLLIDEVNGGGPPDPKAYNSGNDPRVYNKGLSQEVSDKMTSFLCTLLMLEEERVAITEHSLELQIWWRDHKLADATRKSREAVQRISAAKREARAALTEAQRKLLGV